VYERPANRFVADFVELGLDTDGLHVIDQSSGAARDDTVQ